MKASGKEQNKFYFSSAKLFSFWLVTDRLIKSRMTMWAFLLPEIFLIAQKQLYDRGRYATQDINLVKGLYSHHFYNSQNIKKIEKS